MSTQAKLGSAIFDSLTKLRAKKGSFNMEDVGALFEQISATLHPTDNAVDNHFIEEIQKLAVFIKQTKDEISVIAASGGSKEKDGAALHLDAVIKATEEAGHTIMDAADAIMAASAGIGGDKEQAINAAITKIYEACNFQDITCQRLSKVIKILDEIDSRINNVLKLFGPQLADDTTNLKPAEGSQLLNGPQLPDTAPSQADIDALFADFKP